MAKDFKQGVLVWAKMKGFPPWPARVAFPTDGKEPKSKKPQHYVYFFGTHDFAWILDQHIFPHSEEMLANAKMYKKKSNTMQMAIQEIECAKSEEIECAKDEEIEEKSEEIEEKGEENVKLVRKKKKKKGPASSSTASPPPSPPEIVPEKTPKISKKKPISKKKVKAQNKKLTKRSASVTSNDSENDVKFKVNKNEDSDEDYSLLIANVPPNNGYPNVAIIPPYNDDSEPSFASMCFKGEASNSSLVSSPTSKSRIKKLKNEFFTPTTKKIGFLGLGKMGCELVKRLLSTEHNVTIWNRRTLDIYADFVEAGAKTAQNPAAVIQECDITFCCVSDTEAAKNIVFGNNGVLAGFDGLCSNKAYVELTSIDPVTSQEISEAISGKGGRYLEAPMIGKREDISKSSIYILSAGDRSLFSDCNTVFAAWAKNAFYLSCDVGLANKMSLILSMLTGTAFAALGESIALIEKCNIDTSFFMDIIGSGPASSPLLLEKGFSMVNHDNKSVYKPLKHQQKDLAMALDLGHTSQQPLALTVAANESFKRALQNDHENDLSAINKIQ